MILLVLIVFCINVGGKASSSIIIPKDAIRFRVIANSNSIEDQQTKKAVKDQLTSFLQPILLENKTKKQMKASLLENKTEMETVVQNELREENRSLPYTIDYGMHYFPEKEYQGVTYQEGEYESLVVRLGKGEGENFWCVLFPPLCLLEGEKTESEKVEYTSFIQEILDSLFH